MNYTRSILIVIITAVIQFSCADKNDIKKTSTHDLSTRLEKLNKQFIEAAKAKDFSKIQSYYAADAILMPEYQPTLDSIDEITRYYAEIFKREAIVSYEKDIQEIITLENTVIEIGHFRKSVIAKKTQRGKYWNVWEVVNDGSLRLKAEAFGFFHPLEQPANLVVIKKNTTTLSPRPGTTVPFELKAYNALMEKSVRERNGVLRSEFFTNDASFYPFADTVKTGVTIIKPYLIAYNSGPVKIDSINVFTHHLEAIGGDVIEYCKFNVRWTVPNMSGKTEGKGIRLWKRQPDHSLKIHREIGLHDHLE